MKKYIVEVKNPILGDSKRIMTKDELEGFNVVAEMLSDEVDRYGGKHTSGMWTVSEEKTND